MSSKALGTTTSNVEITNVSAHGLHLLAGTEALFLSFDDFPWFRGASIGAISHVTEPAPGHFHWPELDIDLCLDTIRHPERFPLLAK